LGERRAFFCFSPLYVTLGKKTAGWASKFAEIGKNDRKISLSSECASGNGAEKGEKEKNIENMGIKYEKYYCNFLKLAV